MNWATIKTWMGEPTTIAGVALLASISVGWATGQMSGGQAAMGAVGAVFLIVFRQNMQTVLTSAGGPVNVGRINTDQATVNMSAAVPAPEKSASTPTG